MCTEIWTIYGSYIMCCLSKDMTTHREEGVSFLRTLTKMSKHVYNNRINLTVCELLAHTQPYIHVVVCLTL